MATLDIFLSLTFVAFVSGWSGENKCKDFVRDQCSHKDNIIYEELNAGGIQNCQYYCNTTFSEECKHFYYDLEADICNILDGKFMDCTFHAGPQSPNIKDCPDEPAKDSCEVNQIWNVPDYLETSLISELHWDQLQLLWRSSWSLEAHQEQRGVSGCLRSLTKVRILHLQSRPWGLRTPGFQGERMFCHSGTQNSILW